MLNRFLDKAGIADAADEFAKSVILGQMIHAVPDGDVFKPGGAVIKIVGA